MAELEASNDPQEAEAIAPPSAGPNAPLPQSVGQRAGRGFLWMAGQTVGVKMINLAGQIILARFLLTKHDFGLYALALTVATFTSLLQQAGLNTILVQRSRKFGLWSTPAFWIGLTFGAAGALAMLAAAPIAARVYDAPGLTGLIAVLALRGLLDSVAIVPFAKLESELRYRLISGVGLAANFLATGLSLVLAWYGFGAYSFVIPLVAASLLRTITYWLAARPAIKMTPMARRWRYVLSSSALLAGANILFMLTGQGDNMLLGIFHSEATVGVYVIAYSFSTQILHLITNNLSQVMLPSLALIKKNPERQVSALAEVVHLIAWVAVPACALQFVLAGTLVRLLLGTRWLGAITPLRILTIGIALGVCNAPCISFVRARGEFAKLFRMAALCAAAFFVIVTPAAMLGGAAYVAGGVTTYLLFANFYCLVVGAGTWRAATRWFFSALVAPGLISAAAAWSAVAVLNLANINAWGSIALALAIPAVMLPVYVIISRLLIPRTVSDFMRRSRQALSRKRGPAST